MARPLDSGLPSRALSCRRAMRMRIILRHRCQRRTAQVPPPARGSSRRSAPCALIHLRASGSPSPVPSGRPLSKGRNSRCTRSGGMPGPLSRIRTPDESSCTCTRPPRGEAWQAFFHQVQQGLVQQEGIPRNPLRSPSRSRLRPRADGRRRASSRTAEAVSRRSRSRHCRSSGLAHCRKPCTTCSSALRSP